MIEKEYLIKHRIKLLNDIARLSDEISKIDRRIADLNNQEIEFRRDHQDRDFALIGTR